MSRAEQNSLFQFEAEGSSDAADSSGSGTPYRELPAHLQKMIDLLPLNTPVHRSVLEEGYGNSNYARRLRKIVDEYGWDIERQRGKNGANDDWYIRRSEGPVRPQNIRIEVNPTIRLKIYERDAWKCCMCHCSVHPDEQDDTKAQCDHKIPARRGGPTRASNLQTLCTRCNLKKRQECQSCKLSSCNSCPFAFPENCENLIIVSLDTETATRLRALTTRDNITLGQLISDLTKLADD